MSTRYTSSIEVHAYRIRTLLVGSIDPSEAPPLVSPHYSVTTPVIELDRFDGVLGSMARKRGLLSKPKHVVIRPVGNQARGPMKYSEGRSTARIGRRTTDNGIRINPVSYVRCTLPTDVYLSKIAHRANRAIKVLQLFARDKTVEINRKK